MQKKKKRKKKRKEEEKRKQKKQLSQYFSNFTKYLYAKYSKKFG